MQSIDSTAPARSHTRWVICAMLFFAAVINYIDRQILGLLSGDLKKEFGWDERTYAAIVFTFQAAYAIGMLLSGRIIDRIGLRWGFSIMVTLWSVAAVGHAVGDRFSWLEFPALMNDDKLGFGVVTLTGAAAGFAIMRFVLGLGEAGNFPASIKAVAEWFPKKERAFATGIFNSGTNVAVLITPLLVPWIVSHWGWQGAFFVTGSFGFLWLLWWHFGYRSPEDHPGVSVAELAHIRSDPPESVTPVKWARLFPVRQTWAFAAGKFFTDPVWWLYLFWIPGFLKTTYGLDLKSMGLPLIVIYLIADVGSIGGGWLSSSLIQRGWTVNRARKITMLLCALCVVPIVFASQVSNLWVSVFLVGLAAAAHQGWSANLFTLTSDMFPRRAVGSVVGIGGMSGSIGGMVLALVVGEVLQQTGSYQILWFIAGSAYLVALGIIHLLAPRLEPAKVE